MDTFIHFLEIGWELKWYILAVYVILVAVWGYEMGIAPVVDDDGN